MELSLFWTLWLLAALIFLGTGIRLTQRRLQAPQKQEVRRDKPGRRKTWCGRCGAALRREDQFCGYCGQEVHTEAWTRENW
ncbi:MAG TPA: zinc ribbon domain-containing protein [Ktedonobacteraceae bacterium]|nr:zinc ribbon domain-containing protein [Ktedonobacteraceae bacterium]